MISKEGWCSVVRERTARSDPHEYYLRLRPGDGSGSWWLVFVYLLISSRECHCLTLIFITYWCGSDAQTHRLINTTVLRIHLFGTLFRLDDAEDARYGDMLLNNSMGKYEQSCSAGRCSSISRLEVPSVVRKWDVENWMRGRIYPYWGHDTGIEKRSSRCAILIGNL